MLCKPPCAFLFAWYIQLDVVVLRMSMYNYLGEECFSITSTLKPVLEKMARCTKKDILLFCVIEVTFSFINQESR